jgi:hypothetical protein
MHLELIEVRSEINTRKTGKGAVIQMNTRIKATLQ